MTETQIPAVIMSTELILKLALAELLPDLIEETDLCNFKWKSGTYCGEVLRDTEWDHVLKIAQSRHAPVSAIN